MFSASFAQSLTSDEIVQKYITVIGGIDELKKMNQLTMYSKAVSGDNIYELLAYEDNIDKYQFAKVTGTGYEVRSYFDLKSGWILQNGAKQDFDAARVEQFKTVIEDGTYFYLTDMESRGIKTELLGEEKIEGKDCYKIKMTRNGKDKNILYFDKETFYLTELKSLSESVIITYSDYREVPGTNLKLPYKSDKGAIKSTVDKYEINVPLDPMLLIFDK